MSKTLVSQMEIEKVSNKARYFSVIESLLFIAGDPLELKSIASILECSTEFAENIMKELMYLYETEEHRGMKILKINDTYQLVTKQENSEFIQKLLNINVRQSLSQAALETLAIIVYKQPITRVEIEEIRGVKSDRALSTLMDKKLIKESGRKEVPGRPILYSTTKDFLKYFDLENIDELPELDSLLIEE